MKIRGKSISIAHTILSFVVIAAKVILIGSSSAGYYYPDSSSTVWDSQPYMTQRSSSNGWQNYQQQLQDNSRYYNSAQSSPVGLPNYNINTAQRYSYWQPQNRRSFQQQWSPYGYPYSNYGYGNPYNRAGYYYQSPDDSFAWRDYLMAQQRRRQDIVMPYGLKQFPEVTTPAPITTTAAPKKPRKSKLFVANVWG